MEINKGQREQGKQIFSLIEMLVVISLLAILVSLMTPSLKRVLDYTTDLACFNNYKQMATARMLYSDDNENSLLMWRSRRPYQTVWEVPWYAFLYPYMGEKAYNEGGKLSNVDALHCPKGRVGLISGSPTKDHMGYGYNYKLDIDDYTPPPPYYCLPRKIYEVASPTKTIEIGENYRLEGYSGWNGDLRPILHGGSFGFQFNCADVHQGMTQVLWVDGHASGEYKDDLKAQGSSLYDIE